jgi:hypothetical protein
VQGGKLLAIGQAPVVEVRPGRKSEFGVPNGLPGLLAQELVGQLLYIVGRLNAARDGLVDLGEVRKVAKLESVCDLGFGADG